MLLIDILPTAYRNLNRRKVRTALTALAVFIGIFLLSTMISLGLGVRKWLFDQITGQIEYTRITVAREGTMSGGSFSGMMSGEGTLVGEEELKKAVITQEVYEQISQMDHVIQVQAMLMSIPKSAKLEGQEKDIINIMGAGFNLEEKDAYVKSVLAGDIINWEKDNNNALITQRMTQVYGVKPEETIGKTLTLKFNKEGQGGMGLFTQSQGEEIIFEQKIVGVIDVGEDQLNYAIPVDRQIEIAISKKENLTKEEYLKNTGYPFLYVNTDDLKNTKGVAEEIKKMGFDAITVDELISMINTVFIVMQGVLAIFGLIALFVAAIGIINTMIMSIYERTKEIGVMKAVGAQKQDIRKIFVAEAGLIGLLGGVSGVIAGCLTSYGINKALNLYLQKIGEASQNFFTFPWQLSLGCIFFAILVGIVSGLYPASRAANLDPIDTLRYE